MIDSIGFNSYKLRWRHRISEGAIWFQQNAHQGSMAPEDIHIKNTPSGCTVSYSTKLKTRQYVQLSKRVLWGWWADGVWPWSCWWRWWSWSKHHFIEPAVKRKASHTREVDEGHQHQWSRLEQSEDILDCEWSTGGFWIANWSLKRNPLDIFHALKCMDASLLPKTIRQRQSSNQVGQLHSGWSGANVAWRQCNNAQITMLARSNSSC